MASATNPTVMDHQLRIRITLPTVIDIGRPYTLLNSTTAYEYKAAVNSRARVSFIHDTLPLARDILANTKEVGRTEDEYRLPIHSVTFAIPGTSYWAVQQQVNVVVGHYNDAPQQLTLAAKDLKCYASVEDMASYPRFVNPFSTRLAPDDTSSYPRFVNPFSTGPYSMTDEQRNATETSPAVMSPKPRDPPTHIYVGRPGRLRMYDAIVDPATNICYIDRALPLARKILKTPEIARTGDWNSFPIHLIDLTVWGETKWRFFQRVRVVVGEYHNPPTSLVLAPKCLIERAETSKGPIVPPDKSAAQVHASTPPPVQEHARIKQPKCKDEANPSYSTDQFYRNAMLGKEPAGIQHATAPNESVDDIIVRNDATPQQRASLVTPHTIPTCRQRDRDKTSNARDNQQALTKPSEPSTPDIANIHLPGRQEVRNVARHSVIPHISSTDKLPVNNSGCIASAASHRSTPLTHQSLDPFRMQYAARAYAKGAGLDDPFGHIKIAGQFPFDPGIGDPTMLNQRRPR